MGRDSAGPGLIANKFAPTAVIAPPTVGADSSAMGRDSAGPGLIANKFAPTAVIAPDRRSGFIRD